MRKLFLALGLAITLLAVAQSGLQASVGSAGGGTCSFTCANGKTYTLFCHAPGETLQSCCAHGDDICGEGGMSSGHCEDDKIGILCPVKAVGAGGVLVPD
jgi:hypothetical protein